MTILDKLSDEERRKIVMKECLDAETVFFEGGECLQIGVVVEGRIDIISYLENGKAVLYNSLRSGDIFGNNLIFSSRPVYKGNITAVGKTKLALIGKEDLIRLLQENTGFLLEYLKIQSNFSKRLNGRIRLLSIDSARERLLYFLHAEGGQISFRSVSDLAEQLYLQRETLSRLLSRLEKEGKIIRDGHIVRLVL